MAKHALYEQHEYVSKITDFYLSFFSVLSQFDGQRNKLVACDGNEIDTMFVDRRRDHERNGHTLVNCSAGSSKLCHNQSHCAWCLKCPDFVTGHLLWGERWFLWGGLHEHSTGRWGILFIREPKVCNGQYSPCSLLMALHKIRWHLLMAVSSFFLK